MRKEGVMEAQKYELTDETKMIQSADGPVTLHRIRAVVDFGNVKAGELGGWIESEKNLSQEGNAWVHDNAQVSGNAHVYNTAQISGNAQISEYACVHDNARVYGNAKVYGGARVFDEARVYGNSEIYDYCFVHGSARVYEHADVSGDAQISGAARVYGNTKISEKARISGNARVYGDTVVNGDTSIFEHSEADAENDSHAASEDKVSELIHTLEENDMLEHAKMLKDLCGQVDTMSEQLQEMSVRLSEAEWQLRESGIDIHKAVAELKEENWTLQERLSDIRKSLVSKAADIMESVKTAGKSALNRVVEFTGIRDAMIDVRGRVRGNIQHLENTIEHIERAGELVRGAKQNIKDAFSEIRGKAPKQSAAPKERSLTKTDVLKKPFEVVKDMYTRMDRSLTASICSLDVLPMSPDDKAAFIEGMEFAKDLNASNITPDDLELYEALIKERTEADAQRKYEFTGQTKTVSTPDGLVTLHRIRAVTDFGGINENKGRFVRTGELGGWIESEQNLSRSGNAWVSKDAEVYGNASVSEDARVYGNAQVSGNAKIYGHAEVFGNAVVNRNVSIYENAKVSGDAKPSGDAKIHGRSWVLGNAQVYGNADVYGNSKIYGESYVCGNAKVSGRAWIYDNARVFENAQVSGDAKISGNSNVYGNTRIYGNNLVYKDIRAYRQDIRADIRANNFKPSKVLVANIERLDAVTGRRNTVQDIKELAKNPDISAEAKSTANEITEQLQRQEMQVPKPPAVEPA